MNTCAGYVCFYHKNCFDGICAAWVIHRMLKREEEGADSFKFPAAQFIPFQYGDNQLLQTIQQDCFENANINTHYILVDISFPRDLMIQMSNKAKSILVLDHHKTAEDSCRGLDFCRFDMNESGASLAWKYFNSEPVPNLVKYIADRDLWKFDLPNSKEINAYIQSFPMTIEDYEYLYDTLENYSLNKAVDIGTGIERYKTSMVESMCSNATPTKMNEYLIPVINSTLLFSEVGHYMCNQSYSWLGGNKPVFAASYFIRPDGKKQWSLRSIGDFDVSAIAKRHGGGGHKNAAGFETGEK